jgi:hypothetical protein
VNGNVYARGSKTITRENVSVKEYHQEGSVGVVNGNGDFGGVLNHGGNDRGKQAPIMTLLNLVLKMDDRMACRIRNSAKEEPDPLPRFR